MPYYQVWEEFSRAVEKLYLTEPMKVRPAHLRRCIIILMFCCNRNHLTNLYIFMLAGESGVKVQTL